MVSSGLAGSTKRKRLLSERSRIQQSIDLRRRRGLDLGGMELGARVYGALVGNCGPLRALGSHGAPPIAQYGEAPGQAAKFAGVIVQCGDFASADRVVEQVMKLRPLDTLLNGLYIPELRAAIELNRNQPEKALELLKPAAQYERADAWAPYLRGQAYLRVTKGSEAEAEFQKIIDIRNLEIVELLRPMSYVGLARGAALAGDSLKAKNVYQEFFNLWKDADQEIPLLIQARKEYEALR